MRLDWLRSKKELNDVLQTPKAPGPDIAYWIFGDLTEEKWANMTIVTPGRYGKEFPKTYGHYHSKDMLEIYRLTAGNGILLLQKKYYSKGKYIPNIIKEAYLVKFDIGDELIIPPDFGHSWTNVGDTPLITFDDWRAGHTGTDYELIKRFHGMCFYIVDDNGIKFVANPNYKKHPDPKVITAKQFKKLYPYSYN